MSNRAIRPLIRSCGAACGMSCTTAETSTTASSPRSTHRRKSSTNSNFMAAFPSTHPSAARQCRADGGTPSGRQSSAGRQCGGQSVPGERRGPWRVLRRQWPLPRRQCRLSSILRAVRRRSCLSLGMLQVLHVHTSSHPPADGVERATWNPSEMPLPPCTFRATRAISSALPQVSRLMSDIDSGTLETLADVSADAERDPSPGNFIVVAHAPVGSSGVTRSIALSARKGR